MNNVKIKSIEVYHPENVVGNEFFIEHFKKYDKDIAGMLKAFGKEKRYLIENDKENTLTMGIEAAKKALRSAGIIGKDIDCIIFSSQMPEYSFPTQALIVHKYIEGKDEAMCTDSNTNCVGMLVAFDNAARYLQNNKHTKRALIIGADYTSIHCRKDDEMTYPVFGDGACAMVIEKTDEESGFIDSVYKTNSEEWDLVKFPACGLSKIYDSSVYDRQLHWTPFDGSFIGEFANESVHKLLDRHNMKIEDIKAYCFSQFAFPIITSCSQAMGEDLSKYIYIGNKYGYTGTSSPFIALYEGIKSGTIQRGDNVCLWSVGTNWTTCAIMLKY
ncbi:ketoacyl-ACP synthase III [Clostridium sp. 'White wine YQ']|uniref:ketoacyl-ACP synthase III n=1 Tax=Clostridium sp. 'White wine YQ' TaxID=3027474 RepID=UPI0023666275|nr:ketoacyl-ACP synthase III [Clostridium sp. 'White wine YQ']MDD7795853.1 ketoacyl-ACP synthase III [Clostridium sp. 'White wine YQ']